MNKILKTLRPIKPNKGIELWYRKQLMKLVDDMQNSVTYWIEAEYKKQLSDIEMAQDAIPANALYFALRKLFKRWKRNFDKKALKLAKQFVSQTYKYTETALSNSLKTFQSSRYKTDLQNFTVEMQMTPGLKNATQSFIHENVNLIKSIPEKYFTEVEGMVMRSVRDGGDLVDLSDNLQDRYGITRRRAILIARDQNNKATSQIDRVRKLDMGFTRAIWKHPTGIKEPRHSHEKADGKIFDLRKGCYIDGEYIFPGEKINCHCYQETMIEDLL